MISDKHRFIFVHINKTGGTSIEKAFLPLADQKDEAFKHASAKLYKTRFPDKFDDYFKFSFVRNPWDWLVSRYHWSKDHQRLIDYSFREFLDRLETGRELSAAARWMEAALAPQLNRLTIDDRIAVDFVGRFERLHDDFHHLCLTLQLNSPPALPHVFKTDHAFYADYYDDQTAALVERLYAVDIGAFGYRFGD
jgi:hypothetical protein